MAQLYALFDPDDFRPRYIGIAYVSIAKRRKAHIAAARNGVKTHRVYEWIRDLLAAGREPMAMEIDHIPMNSMRDCHHTPYTTWERRAIEHWRVLYPDLLNGRCGSHMENRARLADDRRHGIVEFKRA